MRIAWRIYFGIQAIAALAYTIAGQFEGDLGVWLWFGGVLFLMPGIRLVGHPIDGALSGGGFSMAEIYTIEIVCTVVVNAILWAAILWAIKRLRSHDAT